MPFFKHRNKNVLNDNLLDISNKNEDMDQGCHAGYKNDGIVDAGDDVLPGSGIGRDIVCWEGDFGDNTDERIVSGDSNI